MMTAGRKGCAGNCKGSDYFRTVLSFHGYSIQSGFTRSENKECPSAILFGWVHN